MNAPVLIVTFQEVFPDLQEEAFEEHLFLRRKIFGEHAAHLLRDLAQLPGGLPAAFCQENAEFAVILRVLAPIHKASAFQPPQCNGNRWCGDIEMIRKLFLGHALLLIQQSEQVDLPGMEVYGAAEGKIPGKAEPDDLKKEPDRGILVMGIQQNNLLHKD